MLNQSQTRVIKPWKWVVGILVLLFGLQFWGTINWEPEQITLAQLAALIEDEQVTQIEVNGDSILVTQNSGKVVSAYKEADSLIEEFSNLGVSRDNLERVNITSNDTQVRDFLINLSLSTISLILIIGLLVSVVRRPRPDV